MSHHLKFVHKVEYKQYYDKFFKSEQESICKGCSAQTEFSKEYNKYKNYCSKKCQSASSPLIKKYNKDAVFMVNQRTRLSALCKKNINHYYNKDKVGRELRSEYMKSAHKDPVFKKKATVGLKAFRESIAGKEKMSLLAMERIKDPNDIFGQHVGRYGEYNGTFMRSGLERKIAKKLDHLCIKWQYEPKFFKFSTNKRYLPDFFLPELGVWIEVKPERFIDDRLKLNKKLLEEEFNQKLVIICNDKFLLQDLEN